MDDRERLRERPALRQPVRDLVDLWTVFIGWRPYAQEVDRIGSVHGALHSREELLVRGGSAHRQAADAASERADRDLEQPHHAPERRAMGARLAERDDDKI